jgi:DNA-directed RNA polymerase beta subunit
VFPFLQESPEDGGWHDLVSKGFIEYIDTEEEETTMISMTINVSTVILDLLKCIPFISSLKQIMDM